jgi:hypothetical protein
VFGPTPRWSILIEAKFFMGALRRRGFPQHAYDICYWDIFLTERFQANNRLPEVPPRPLNGPGAFLARRSHLPSTLLSRRRQRCASCAAVVREIRRRAEMQSHGALSVRLGGESMFKRLRLATNAAYADHRWNLYGTFRRVVTVTARDHVRLVIH